MRYSTLTKAIKNIDLFFQQQIIRGVFNMKNKPPLNLYAGFLEEKQVPRKSFHPVFNPIKAGGVNL